MGRRVPDKPIKAGTEHLRRILTKAHGGDSLRVGADKLLDGLASLQLPDTDVTGMRTSHDQLAVLAKAGAQHRLLHQHGCTIRLVFEVPAQLSCHEIPNLDEAIGRSGDHVLAIWREGAALCVLLLGELKDKRGK